MFLLNSFFALGEELGWRGYLLRSLKSRATNFYVRAFIIGFIWGLWHLPLYIKIGVTLPRFGIFMINVCLISLLYTWLFERNNVIWPTVVAHATHNVFLGVVLPTLTLSQNAAPLWFGEEGILTTAGYVLFIGSAIVGASFVRSRARSEKNYSRHFGR